MIRNRLLAVAALLPLSATAWADLKTYDVAPEYQQEIYTALNSILNSSAPGMVNGASYGRVQQLPSGQILVNAEAETLQQVEQVLAAIRTQQTAATPRASLRYWAVLGARTQPGDNDPGAPPPPALDAALAELRRVHGDLRFRVMGSAALVSASGQRGEVRGTTLGIEQVAFVRDATLNAEISIRLYYTAAQPLGTIAVGNLSLRTSLEPGEFVVLGESHVQAAGLDGPVFYMVTWER